MSPLVNSPQRGYTDYQRLDNYDSGTLATVAITNSAINSSTGILDVSRYNAIAGNLNCSLGVVLMFVQWYSDPAGTEQITGRRVFMDSLIQRQMQFCFVNQGPFVQMQFVFIAATNYSVAGTVHGTNREHPTELLPVDPVVIDAQNLSIFASFTKTVAPLDYCAGPAQLWVLSLDVPLVVSMGALTLAGTYDNFCQLSPLAVGTELNTTVVIPPGAYSLDITNTSAGAGHFYAALTPSTSGAS